MEHTERNTTSQAAAGGDDTEQLLDDVRLRFNLKPQAVTLLKALLQAGPDRWHFTGPVAELLAMTGWRSDKTVRDWIKVLEGIGLVTSGFINGRVKTYHVREGVMRGEEAPFDATMQTTFTESAVLGSPPSADEPTAVDAAAAEGPTAVDSDAETGYRGSDSTPDPAGYRGNSTAVAAAPVSVGGQSQSPSVPRSLRSVPLNGGYAENFHRRRDLLPWDKDRTTDIDLQTLDRQMLATLFRESVRTGHIDSALVVEFYATAYHCATNKGLQGKRAKVLTGRINNRNYRGVVDAAWDWAKQVVRDPTFAGAPKRLDEQEADLQKFRDRCGDDTSPAQPANASFDPAHRYALEILAATDEPERGRPP
jgi:hypothetical protein